MSTILLVTDSDRVMDRVHAALTGPDMTIIDEPDPAKAAEVAYDKGVDAVLVDMQVGSMGAVAVTHSIRDAVADNDPIPVTILMNRDADAFLAGRSGATNWVKKTAPAEELRQAVSPTGSST